MRRKSNYDFLHLASKSDHASFWARCFTPGGTAVLSVDTGVGVVNANADVYIQDQTSQIIDKFVTQKLNKLTLAVQPALEARTITLAAGHNMVAGNMIEISDGTNCYQSRVINVATNVITVTNPMHFSFLVTSTAWRTSPDLNVDGSTTPVVFTFEPPENVEYDVNMLSINILNDTAMDDGNFGGITALTNGVIFRTVNDHIMPIFTALDNGCFIRHCDVEDPYSDKAPAGVYGFNTKRHFNGQNGDGVARRIGHGSQFQVIVQDNLTGLSRFWVVLRGHKVED